MRHGLSTRVFDRVIGAIVWLVLLHGWSSNSFAADCTERAASSNIASHAEPSSSSSLTSVGASNQSAALSEAIYQNTPGNSQGHPVGLSWDTGVYGTHTQKPAPSGFAAVTGWGVVYQQSGVSVSPNAASDSVQIANFTTYVHLTNGTWVEVQSQARDGIAGAHYVADFSGDASIPWRKQTLPDGSVSVDAPPSGYNDHFWPGVRGTFTPDTVDGVFIAADIKTNDPSANLVAQIGADWWLNSSAEYVDGFANNPVVGGNNFIKLTRDWQTLYYTSLSPQQLRADLPPPLLNAPCPRQ